MSVKMRKEIYEFIIAMKILLLLVLYVSICMDISSTCFQSPDHNHDTSLPIALRGSGLTIFNFSFNSKPMGTCYTFHLVESGPRAYTGLIHVFGHQNKVPGSFHYKFVLFRFP